jgi:putative Mn2+ efflux pump MntP
MGFGEIMVIAVGLSMDAFAVSITLGLSAKKIRITEFLLPGIYFGFFQALMPLLGYYGGTTFSDKVQHLDHWITFVLLGLIGGNMIREGFSKKEEETSENPFKFYKMLLLAIATSIDALAVGVTFAFFKINIGSAIFIIGLTTFFVSIGGVKIGNLFGIKYKSKAEILGGIVLIAIGTKILIEHLFFT